MVRSSHEAALVFELLYLHFDSPTTGSYGSPPIPVLNAMHRLSDQCESNPDLFMRKSYLPLLTDVRKQLAEMVNADVEDCVIVSMGLTRR